MNEILTTAMTALVLLAGLAALVIWSRRDTFAGPGTGHRTPDPLAGRPSDRTVRVRPQRTRNRAAGDVRPGTYESQATTATA